MLGHPVAHSLSPQLHNAAFAARGVDAVYVAFDVPPGMAAAAVEGVRALGLLGANVTVPHKRAVWEAVGWRTEEAELIGAANTLFWEDGRLVADNTDAAGLLDVLVSDVGVERGDEVVIFGAGGAARAAAVAFGRCGAVVEVVARRDGPRAEVSDLVARSGGIAGVCQHPRIVCNATPLGLAGESLPDRFMSLKAEQVALDLVYGPRPTPFLQAARARGARGIDGAGMLVGQAARAFTRWTGLDAPVEEMARTLDRLIGR